MSRSNLTLDEARRRAGLLADPEYEVHLDLLAEDRAVTETAVRFRCTEPGAGTFLDCADVEVVSAELNGRALPLGANDGTRVRLEGLAERNEVRLVTRGAYSNTGKGLNRFVDPVDGTVYVHTDSEPFDAHRWYPCFDQPDLKGTFRFSATVPQGWEVVSNARAEGPPAEENGGRRWTFGATPPISTYVTVVTAGPFHKVVDRHRDIDLGVYCRQSLAEHLEPEEWLEITRQGLDWFEEAFGHPYPFDKYDQVVVPEFAAGAMENPGCVTFHEHYIFRSRVTRTQRELRAGTVLHEMAHMWFGDLVTMRWWNDLWLNESFASYMGVLAQVESTRFTEGWTIFANAEKTWALQQDQLPTTHPVVAEIPDLISVHLNFDGITYAKGAAVLKQLVAWVGLDRTLEAMKTYFARHGFGNTELRDFLAVLEEASGRDLDAWSTEWLETPGVNTLRPHADVDGDAYRTFAILQEASEAWPHLRSHRVAVGLYDDRDGRLVRRTRSELDVVGERTEVGDLAGERVAPLALVNDDDLTFAKVRFDEGSLRTVLDRLGDVEESLARSVCWTACWDMTRDAELPARDYVGLVTGHGGRETEVGALERALAQAGAAVDLYGDPANRVPATEALAGTAAVELERSEPGSDHQLAWARAFIGAARSPEHLGVVRGLLDGSASFQGLVVDTDLRWLVVSALAAAGTDDAEALIDAELERDPTDRGQRQAIASRAARPSAEAKAEAWRTILEDRTLSEAMLESAMRGFQQPDQDDLLAPYADRYFETLPGVWDGRDLEFALQFGEQLYPRWIVSEATVRATDSYLGRDGVPGPIRRLLLEGRDRIRRALRARAVDAAASR
ncbi:MAG: aminopeptidase N [Actinomycetota bacterium]